jgi:hypothetical protein
MVAARRALLRSGGFRGEGPAGVGGSWPLPEERAVDRGASDTEQLGQFGGAVGAELGQLDEVLRLGSP